MRPSLVSFLEIDSGMVASVWRRAWRSKVSSTSTQTKQEGGGGGGGLLQPTATCGRSTTSGGTTTYNTLTSDSTGEFPRDLHPLMALSTAPVEEEELDVAKEIEDDRTE